MQPTSGSRALVLGSGNGIHDDGLIKHGLTVIDLDIQPEIAALGLAKARKSADHIGYIVADMTMPLPFAMESVDVIFNIGSSFGYEETDAENAAVFRVNGDAFDPPRSTGMVIIAVKRGSGGDGGGGGDGG